MLTKSQQLNHMSRFSTNCSRFYRVSFCRNSWLTNPFVTDNNKDCVQFECCEYSKETRLLNHFSYKHFLVNNSSVTHSSNIIRLLYSLPSTIVLCVPFIKHPIFASCHKSAAHRTWTAFTRVHSTQDTLWCAVVIFIFFHSYDARNKETRHFWIEYHCH